MEFPFFSNNYWNYPHHHSSSSPAMNPRHWAGVESSPSMNRQTRSPFPKRESRQVETTPMVNRGQTRSSIPVSQSRSQLPKAKVVNIPVRFLDSARSEAMKVTAAVKIQKVFRGLLVRKSLKKIDGIRKEVDEIEKRVSEKETILMMRRDGKERLKMNEMLMKLLLRLDSIRGVDSGVRVFRKSVIKKAIMLQERVDEIVSGDADMVDTQEEEEEEEEEECGAGDDSIEHIAEVVDQNVEIKGSENVVDEDMKLDAEPIAEVVDQALEIKGSENVVEEDTKADDHVEPEHNNAVGEEAMVEAAGDQASELQYVPEVEAENLEEDLMDVQQQSELIQEEKNQNEDSSAKGVVKGGEEKKVVEENGSSNRDLMERMIKGNEVLAGLVAELCERQESQTRLLSSLSQRVENLEKAFRSDRSKRKKRNNNKL